MQKSRFNLSSTRKAAEPKGQAHSGISSGPRPGRPGRPGPRISTSDPQRDRQDAVILHVSNLPAFFESKPPKSDKVSLPHYMNETRGYA